MSDYRDGTKTFKIPETSKDNPYIEFTLNEKGNLIKLEAVDHWCGGINGGWSSTNGNEGNICYPNQLDKYIKRFRENSIKEIEKEIKQLQVKLKKAKKIYAQQ